MLPTIRGGATKERRVYEKINAKGDPGNTAGTGDIHVYPDSGESRRRWWRRTEISFIG